MVDLRWRFGLPSAERPRASRIMVIEIGDQVVDSVSEVLWVKSAVIEPLRSRVVGVEPGSTLCSSLFPWESAGVRERPDDLSGIDRLLARLMMVLDIDRILAREERRALEIAA